MAGACGTCTACCRVYAIPELGKPAGEWCRHCDVGVGCKIYTERPNMCVNYSCFWLESQFNGVNLPVEMRPDKCKVVFSPTTNPEIMAGLTMKGYNDAWRKGSARKIIDLLLKAGLRVAVGAPTSTTKIMIDKYGEKEVKMTAPDKNGMQWSIPNAER